MSGVRFTLARMPMHGNDDSCLYDERDGRYIDGRTAAFPGVCIRSMREAGVLDEVLRSSSVLDVGCGKGELLAEIKALTMEIGRGHSMYIAGEEPLNEARAHAVTGGISEYAYGRYDVVMAWHVIEHTLDPAEFLRGLVRRTHEGSLVIVATPNTGSPFARRRDWRCKIANHTYLLDIPLLRELMEEAGIAVEHVLTWGGYPAPRTWWQETANRLLKATGLGDVMMITGHVRHGTGHARGGVRS